MFTVTPPSGPVAEAKSIVAAAAAVANMRPRYQHGGLDGNCGRPYGVHARDHDRHQVPDPQTKDILVRTLSRPVAITASLLVVAVLAVIPISTALLDVLVVALTAATIVIDRTRPDGRLPAVSMLIGAALAV